MVYLKLVHQVANLVHNGSGWNHQRQLLLALEGLKPIYIQHMEPLTTLDFTLAQSQMQMQWLCTKGAPSSTFQAPPTHSVLQAPPAQPASLSIARQQESLSAVASTPTLWRAQTAHAVRAPQTQARTGQPAPAQHARQARTLTGPSARSVQRQSTRLARQSQYALPAP